MNFGTTLVFFNVNLDKCACQVRPQAFLVFASHLNAVCLSPIPASCPITTQCKVSEHAADYCLVSSVLMIAGSGR
jgi:hypothetical protein